MEIYRKQLDKKILESIKNKIYKYLQSKGLENVEFFKSNMDAVEGLYVPEGQFVHVVAVLLAPYVPAGQLFGHAVVDPVVSA